MSYESIPEDRAVDIAHKIFHFRADNKPAKDIKALEVKLAAAMSKCPEKEKRKAERLAGVQFAKAVVLGKEKEAI
jgi:hypothetical protein